MTKKITVKIDKKIYDKLSKAKLKTGVTIKRMLEDSIVTWLKNFVEEK